MLSRRITLHCEKFYKHRFCFFVMANNEREKIARKNLLRKSLEAKGVAIKGYDFDKGVNYPEIVRSFFSTGFQASNFSFAIDITNAMIKEEIFMRLIIGMYNLRNFYSLFCRRCTMSRK